MSAPQRYPLSWPAHRPRKTPAQRRSGSFKADNKPITMAVAFGRLEDQLRLLGAMYPVLSTNVELRIDGGPRSGQPKPADPGACVYFSLKGEPFALACDTFTMVEQNVAALAAHIDNTRGIERYGVASAAETLQAFSALPPPARSPAADWRSALGFEPTFPGELVPAEAVALVTTRHKLRLKDAHPDQGGSNEAAARLNAARDAALQELQP